MREYKFRGRDEHGVWHYGYLANIRLQSFPRWDSPTVIRFAEIVDEDDLTNRVDPETVGQFTGLKDSDGREIYEGDILSLREGSDEMTKVIDFYAAITALDLSEMMNLRLLDYYFERGEVHVIGNIYYNPELLEATE